MFLGAALGDQVASYLVDDSFGSQLLARTTGSTVGDLFEKEIFFGEFGDNQQLESLALIESFLSDLGSTALSLGSQELSESIIEALKIEDTFAQIGIDTLSQSAVNYVFTSAAITEASLIGSYLESLEGYALSYAGSELFESLVRWNVLGESQVNEGTAIGSTLGGTIGNAFLGPVGSILGTLAGSIAGGFFGDVFGDKDYPRAAKPVEFEPLTGAFIVGTPYLHDDGNLDIANEMALLAEDSLNSIVDLTGGKVISARTYNYGHLFSDFVHQIDHQSADGHSTRRRVKFDNLKEAIEAGILEQLKSVQIDGGDTYVKKVLANHKTNPYSSLQALVADLEFAREYGIFQGNLGFYLNLIANIPDAQVRQELANNWGVIYQRAEEIQLDAEVVPASGKTTSLRYQNFANIDNLAINGGAVQFDTRLYLTGKSNPKNSSVFHSEVIAFDENTSFNSHFVYRASNGSKSRDGFAFILQNSPQGAEARGSGRGYLGFGGDNKDGRDSIRNSLIVEFDTYKNGGLPDPNNNHVGVNANGAIDSYAIATPSIDLNNGQPVNVWIDYDGVTDILQIFLAENSVKPNTSVLETKADLQTTIGSSAFVGFSAASGEGNQSHEILSWDFTANTPQDNSLPYRFNEPFYLELHSSDVGQGVKNGIFKDGLEHFTKYGLSERRIALFDTGNGQTELFGANFDETFYLALHSSDVGQGVENGIFEDGFEHFINHGLSEGRVALFNTDNGQQHLFAPSFDEKFYLAVHSSDVGQGVANGIFDDGFEHFTNYGLSEGRIALFNTGKGHRSLFGADFNEDFYLAMHSSDVGQGVENDIFENGFEHFADFGVSEGRIALFDMPEGHRDLLFGADFNEEFYLESHFDVAQGVSSGTFDNGLDHFTNFGVAEGRVARFDTPDGHSHLFGTDLNGFF
ncbi:hypothetical protein DXZ20_01110 [Leptolyngbyaceae cyanobacterium CCMR0081]|uniref:Legume lectin domain-containing protein n=1 Tax=Adonisia turfae CCMR0081 TaxID=2292702 RepID=A0A6M0REI7_9CYAN|nr:hypothetical protein [Adonisia turfae CCMR0081]